jgi:hypothetical protein
VRRSALILALVLVSCKRQVGPDESFQKGSRLYQQLYASQLDDAYGDPQMDTVVVLLKEVDPRSVDAESATALLGTIQRGREALAKSRAEREKRSAVMQAAAAAPPINIDVDKVLATSAPDAGPQQDPLGPGASIADLSASSGGCIQENEPFRETGGGSATGTIYRLVKGDACASRLPGLQGQMLLVQNGRIYRRMPDQPPTPTPAPDAGRP